MRILIIGSDKVYAIENLYVKYLREAGHEVSHFCAQSMFYDYYQKNLLNKLIYRIGLSSIHNNINKQFKSAVKEFRPEVVWVFKGMELYSKTLVWAKRQGVKLVNYNPDNPFIFSGKGSGNANLKRAIPLYDLHLTYNREVKIQMEREYGIKTEILPFGYDVPDELRNSFNLVDEIVKPCFLGNPDRFRSRFLQQLAEQGIELDVYGNDWNRFVSHRNITIFEPVYGDELWITLRKYRVQLNLMRPHNLTTHNMRSFEIPGVGGIQIAPKTLDHESFFAKNKEIFVFKDLNDCVLQIRYLLALPKDEADRLRLQSKMRSEKSGYSYKGRAAEAVGFFKALYE